MSSARQPRTAHAARHRCAAAALALAVLAAPLPAAADLPAPVAALMQACLDPALSLDQRVGAAHAAGWKPLAEGDRAGAAIALAPWSLLRMRGLDPVGALAPDALADELAARTDHLLRVIEAQVTSDHWVTLSAPEPAFGRIVDYPGDGRGSECEVSLRLDADALTRALALPAQTLERPNMAVTLLELTPGHPGDRGALVSHIHLTGAVRSLVVTPRMPRPQAPAARTP